MSHRRQCHQSSKGWFSQNKVFLMRIVWWIIQSSKDTSEKTCWCWISHIHFARLWTQWKKIRLRSLFCDGGRMSETDFKLSQEKYPKLFPWLNSRQKTSSQVMMAFRNWIWYSRTRITIERFSTVTYACFFFPALVLHLHVHHCSHVTAGGHLSVWLTAAVVL